MFGKPGTSLVTFEALGLRSSLTYHLVYHYSLHMHLNHLVFLNTYVLGMMLVVASAASCAYPSNVPPSAPFARAELL